MRDLDDTDLEILELLSDDARRPHKEIADRVGLTPPAVSDRISRLEEQGIIQGFTVDVDRERLSGELPVLLALEPKPAAVDEIYAAATELDGAEAVLEGMDDRVIVHATIPETTGRSWLASTVDLEQLREYDVTVLDRSERLVELSATGFSHSASSAERTRSRTPSRRRSAARSRLSAVPRANSATSTGTNRIKTL